MFKSIYVCIALHLKEGDLVVFGNLVVVGRELATCI